MAESFRRFNPLNERLIEEAAMITLRPAAERGHTKIDWLDSWHSFSFGEYRDPRHMGFHSLRVINDDRFGAATGFPTHPHRDMEILTWVLAGALEHRRPQESHSPTNPGDHLLFPEHLPDAPAKVCIY